MDALFGIHVGNSSACLSIWKDEDRIEVVANDIGDRVTPTVVNVTPSNGVTGWAAQLEDFKNGSNTIVRNKQLLNDDISDSELEYLKSNLPYVISKSGKHVKYDLVHDGQQHSVSPEEVLEVVYKKIYATAKAAVGGNKEVNAVICVPLHFSSSTIDKIREIVTKVGFNVLQVIDEPSSAALGAGLGCTEEDTPYHCLVYRVGGVTLDATVLLVQDCMFSVVGSVYKYNVGGGLITEKLGEFLACEFLRQYKSAELTDRSIKKLCIAAEHVKQILSIQSLVQCSAESVGGGYDLNCSVSRARFENILANFLPDLVQPVKEVLEKSSLSTTDISKVVLCGGSLKIPKLRDALRSFLTSAEILSTPSPDELISMGAAKQARYCIKYQSIPTELAVDAPCLSVGILVNIKTGEKESDATYNVPKNALLPILRRYEVTAKANSVTGEVDLITGKDVSHLGSTELEDLEPSSVVSIELDITKDGSLSLTLESEAGQKKNVFKHELKSNDDL